MQPYSKQTETAAYLSEIYQLNTLKTRQNKEMVRLSQKVVEISGFSGVDVKNGIDLGTRGSWQQEQSDHKKSVLDDINYISRIPDPVNNLRIEECIDEKGSEGVKKYSSQYPKPWIRQYIIALFRHTQEREPHNE
ncbi:hypothetical protein [Algoriphagus sp. A40]|uniref:hypothetical protein n=1 Tax=Algoriphagus sp. A40 TaxID=1945863 RepID=UPI0011159AD0|nr:hypothetical protein [Algoriphagus sp. A40]